MRQNVSDIISPILWTLLTAGVALALTLSALALLTDPRSDSEPDWETKRAVDCYALMKTSFETVKGSADREAAYDAMDERGCWP